MAHEKELALIPNGDDVDVEAYAGTAGMYRRGINVSVALSRLHIDIITALSSIDSEKGEQVTLGSEIRAAILHYGNLRRQQPGFDEQLQEACKRLEALRAKLGDVATEPPVNETTSPPVNEATEALRRIAEQNEGTILRQTQYRPAGW